MNRQIDAVLAYFSPAAIGIEFFPLAYSSVPAFHHICNRKDGRFLFAFVRDIGFPNRSAYQALDVARHLEAFPQAVDAHNQLLDYFASEYDAIAHFAETFFDAIYVMGDGNIPFAASFDTERLKGLQAANPRLFIDAGYAAPDLAASRIAADRRAGILVTGGSGYFGSGAETLYRSVIAAARLGALPASETITIIGGMDSGPYFAALAAEAADLPQVRLIQAVSSAQMQHEMAHAAVAVVKGGLNTMLQYLQLQTPFVIAPALYDLEQVSRALLLSQSTGCQVLFDVRKPMRIAAGIQELLAKQRRIAFPQSLNVQGARYVAEDVQRHVVQKGISVF